ncbi:Periplasmic binding protein [Hyella patelloides LEGE 07179]|uniref:Periplasmic binding protein n=1 Tax=Hyella patelloides LEGE 07179 TaxID=945734 RepID=A0A563VPL7_9CYAN|nr:iron-siderophore ABC transporter substrate-binding protein [Hyella patelloides]VEP13351.1 Periplasmic binding protein [Hyella patelloides LEGE 07179]
MVSFGFIAIASCSQNNFNDSPKVAITKGEARMVKHALGETAVPVRSQRVLALDNIALDSILALGVKPIAALYNENTGQFPVHLRDRISGVTKLPSEQQNIEEIASLNPDLILGGKNVEQVYKLLSQIAPTIVLAEGGNAEWKEQLKLTGNILGQSEEAEKILQEYDRRLAEFRAEIGDEVRSIEVSVVRIFPDRIRLYQRGSFSGEILAEAGLSRPPAQDSERLWREVSRERIQDADGDVIFVWSLGKEAEQALNQLQDDPLWSQLEAVQQGRVYEVPGYWIGSGPLAANAVIDDLFTHLTQAKP